eukprot:COSAG02_NODE_4137_length_5726_cov_3.623067_7_plen_73_part_00
MFFTYRGTGKVLIEHTKVLIEHTVRRERGETHQRLSYMYSSMSTYCIRMAERSLNRLNPSAHAQLERPMAAH